MQSIQTALSTLPQRSSGDGLVLPQKWVARIFERLTAQLGSKVADLYAGVPPETIQEEWGKALAGFHPNEIERGLSACQTRAFAPTLGEFTRLCRPALDPEYAFIEAERCLAQRDSGEMGDWSHPAVYRAASAMWMEVRAGDYRPVRKRWEYLLQHEFSKGWGEIPQPLPKLTEQKVSTRPPTEDERKRLAEFRDLIAAGFTPSEVRLGMTDVERT